MSIWYNHVRVSIDLNAVVHNFKVVAARVANPIPVVKSDAYGHGLPEVAEALYAAGVRTMAAGTVGEAGVLKERFPDVDVVSLLGPLDDSDDHTVCSLDLIPFVGSTEQLLRLQGLAASVGREVRVALKFDTGMSRLGFDHREVPGLLRTLCDLSSVRAVWACSHLATADDPGQADYAAEQGAVFVKILTALRTAGLPVKACLANSGAIFGHPDLHHDLQRPGIALYGGNPFFGTVWADRCAGLRQAMHVHVPVLQVRNIKKGTTVSYGRTFTAPKDMRIAFVGVGYADNYSRGLSSKAQMLVHGHRADVLGRVCMQLTAIDVTEVPDVQAGDRVHVLGGDGPLTITVDELADWWGTITYEVFCLLGQNPRSYMD